jgi:autotransporter-associated beta strand protein
MMTNNATLDMGGFSIGDGVTPIDSLVLESGTLRNVAEINGGAAWTKTGAGRLTLDGANTFTGAITVNTGVLAAASATALGTTAGGVTVLPGGTLGLQGGVTVSGEAVTITGIGGIDGLTTNAGALRNISGNNTWAGPVTVTGSVDTALFSEEGHFTISGDITDNRTGGNLLLRGNGSGEISGEIAGARPLFKSAAGATNAGTWTLSGLNTYSGSTTIAAGTLRISTEANLGTTPAAYVANQLNLRGGLLQNTASMSISPTRGVTLGTLGGGFDTDAGTTMTVESIVAGVAGNPLIKTGAGSLVLNANNTYVGGTLVSNGTLRINGTYSGGGLISVFSGGTLGGTGSVGAVTVDAGGGLAPGNSAGTLIVGDLTLDGGAMLTYELGTSSDLILAGTTILGGIDFDNFTFLPGAGFGPGVYTLIDATTISGLGAGTAGTVGSYGATLSIDVDDQDLVLTVVPEPASLGLMGLMVAAVLLRRRLL